LIYGYASTGYPPLPDYVIRPGLDYGYPVVTDSHSYPVAFGCTGRFARLHAVPILVGSVYPVLFALVTYAAVVRFATAFIYIYLVWIR